MSEPGLLQPDEVERARASAAQILEGLDRTLFGQEALTRLVLTSCLARGHVLLEGLPGLGKTELVKALAALLGLDWRRLQFTPDLLPGDVTGGHVLEETERGRQLVFHPGPVFTHVLLADEINRASPKTQAALLQAMQESAVTVLGETRELKPPFFVLATQNPIELEGTYPLPEAQLDRFLFKLSVPNVTADVLKRLVTERRRGQAPEHAAVTDGAKLDDLFAAVDRVFLPEAVAGFIARIVAATHPGSGAGGERVSAFVRFGASPRGAIAIAESARALALLDGRPNVGFEDVRTVARPALAHRLVLDYRAKLEGVSAADLVDDVLASVGELDRDLPLEARRS